MLEMLKYTGDATTSMNKPFDLAGKFVPGFLYEPWKKH